MIGTIKKLFSLLNERERRITVLLIITTVCVAFIQVVGIGSIMPFLVIVANPNALNEIQWLNRIYTFFGFTSKNAFMIFLGVGALVVLTLSNVLQIATQWVMLKFIHMRSHLFSMRLLENYLEKPYIFFLYQNSSNFGKDILSEVKLVVKGLIKPVVEILSKGTIALFIIILLFIVNTILALSVVVLLGGAYLLIYFKIKGVLETLGIQRKSANKGRFKRTNEAFAAIKQIKLMNNQKYFLKTYEKPSLQFEQSQAKQEIYSMVPNYALETIAFGGILIIVLYLLISGGNIAQTLPILGLYSYSIMRIKPALQILYSSFSTFKFYQSSLDDLYENLIQYRDTKKVAKYTDVKIDTLPFQNKLQLENIRFRYPGAKEYLFNGINVTIEAKTSVAFIGPTGAGKTTLVDIILGLFRPTEGRLIVDGCPITEENITNWQQNLGYIPQHIDLLDDTVEKNIAFGVPEEKIDRDAVVRAAKMACIHEFITEEMYDGYNTTIGERGTRLSGGQRQRIGIARALYRDPAVLVLDEATSALDSETEEHVLNAIETISKTKTIVIIAHRFSTIKNCDVIYLLENGKIIGEGTYGRLLETNNRFYSFVQKDERATSNMITA